MQTDETRPLSYILHKIHSNYIENLNLRPETIKILEGNTGSKIFDINQGFLGGYVASGKGNKM